jgi:hypothetical protein
VCSSVGKTFNAEEDGVQTEVAEEACRTLRANFERTTARAKRHIFLSAISV